MGTFWCTRIGSEVLTGFCYCRKSHYIQSGHRILVSQASSIEKYSWAARLSISVMLGRTIIVVRIFDPWTNNNLPFTMVGGVNFRYYMYMRAHNYMHAQSSKFKAQSFTHPRSHMRMRQLITGSEVLPEVVVYIIICTLFR